MHKLAASLISRIRSRRRRGAEGPRQDDYDPPTVTFTARQTSSSENIPQSDESLLSPSKPTSLSFSYALAKRWAWAAIAFRCETHPQEILLKEQDFNGDTILHWSCFGSPPSYVIEAILETCPELARIRNRQELLPLHTACMYRASPDIIRALVQVFPESTGMSTSTGQSSPLHLVCDYGCKVDSLLAILETESGAASSQRRDAIYHRTPLQILNERKNLNEFHSHLIELRRLKERNPNALVPSEDGERQDKSMETALLLERIRTMGFWEKAQLLALTEFTQEPVTSVEPVRTTVLHSLIGLNVCPPAILEFAGFMMPQELMRHDENGDLPLHFAARRSHNDVVSNVLRVETMAAGVPNASGLLPLQIYLEGDRNLSWNHVVKNLIVAFPLAIEHLEIDRRLYPLIWSRLTGTRDIDALFLSIQGNPSLFG